MRNSIYTQHLKYLQWIQDVTTFETWMKQANEDKVFWAIQLKIRDTFWRFSDPLRLKNHQITLCPPHPSVFLFE